MSRRKVRKPCEVEHCNRPAKYNLYRQNPNGTKTWLDVCDIHERQIAFDNLKREGHAI